MDGGEADVFSEGPGFGTQGFGEAEDGPLGGAVGGQAGDAHQAGGGGDVDDAAEVAAVHLREDGVGDAEHCVEIDVHGAMPGGDLLIGEVSGGHEAGVVDEDVDAAEGFLGGTGAGADFFGLAYVADVGVYERRGINWGGRPVRVCFCLLR